MKDAQNKDSSPIDKTPVTPRDGGNVMVRIKMTMEEMVPSLLGDILKFNHKDH